MLTCVDRRAPLVFNRVLDNLNHDGLAFKHLFFNRYQGLILAREHGGFATFLTLPHIGHVQKSRALKGQYR